MKRLFASSVFTLACLLPSAPASASLEPYIGEIQWFAFNFCPRGWAETNGALLPIAQNTALFSLIGTQFGGDGRTTFALPDLRGRSLVARGQGPGLPVFNIGQRGGAENQTLTIANMPPHHHDIQAYPAASEPGNTSDPVGSYLADGQRAAIYRKAEDTSAIDYMADPRRQTGISGAGQAVPVRDPYLVMTACIATQGIFPSRN